MLILYNFYTLVHRILFRTADDCLIGFIRNADGTDGDRITRTFILNDCPHPDQKYPFCVIKELILEENYKRQGYGTLLISMVVEKCREMGHERVFVADHNLMKAYSECQNFFVFKCGFDRHHGDGILDHYFVMDLTYTA